MVVVLHHVLLLTPPFSRTYRDGHSPGKSVYWWLTETPLHVFWIGDEAVLVFFVLSGLVIALPVLRTGAQFDWLAYYGSRLPRLYIPVWAAVALSAGATIYFPHVPVAWSSWLNETSDPTLPGLVKDLTLVYSVDHLNNPIWSLRWEVIFSVLLPVYIWCALRVRGWLLLPAVLFILAASTIGSLSGNHASATFLPVFALGTLIAANWDILATSLPKRGTRFWIVIVVGSILLLTAMWIARNWWSATVLWGATMPLRLVGATLIVIAFAFWSPVQRMAASRLGSYLGKRSFSLYLIHWPVVTSVAIAFGRPVGAPLLMAICLPASILVAETFYWLVERPSHRLSQHIRSRIHGRRVGTSRQMTPLESKSN